VPDLTTDSQGEDLVPVRFKTSGCAASIVASVILTIVLNLLLRACAG
jgi:NifU-like protein involved in Fe-S cluster formation